MNWGQNILIVGLRVYQRVISPALAGLFGPAGRCRFEPSCSQYAVEAVQIHGAGRGSALAAWRVCRCHPWGGCGLDPVPGKHQASRFKFQVGESARRARSRQTIPNAQEGASASAHSRPARNEWGESRREGLLINTHSAVASEDRPRRDKPNTAAKMHLSPNTSQ